jgi:nitrogen-specific signal transduction histidine kinase
MFIKNNTIHLILEEILEAHEHSLQAKNIKVVKNFEENLPETFVHEEHVRFILNSILHYAILSTPHSGRISFLTKSIHQKGAGEDKIIALKERNYVEILIVSSNHGDPFEQSEDMSEGPALEKDKTFGLILQLIEELVQRSQGLIEFEVDERRSKTFFSIRLPGDRRQSVYYEPIKL